MCCHDEPGEECCCSPRDKAIFFACWTAAHVLYIISMIGASSFSGEFVLQILEYLTVLFHLAGTVFLFTGIYAEQATPFFLGIVFSSVYPYVLFYTLYLPIVQVVFTYSSCQYYQMLKQAKVNEAKASA
ncbi:hypothetical protein KR222_002064 [Zaprionus bogoriensis]|nr:hypothetical protein KR222_002064 [Zaprionus bogoriensis]